MEIKQFKQKLSQYGVCGLFMKTCDGAFVEAAAGGGMDFCILDTEHGPVSYENMQNLIRAAECAGILPIVRVAENTEEYIGKALDIGAAGIQVPQVCDEKSARDAVTFAKFSPQGQRGVCRFVRAANYSALDKFEYFRQANETIVILQIEGEEGVRNLPEILQVPGIDVIFVGPYDLSQSLGVTGQVTHPLVVEKIKEIICLARERGIKVGTFVDSVKEGLRWKQEGVKYIAHSVDVGIFYEACRDVANGLSCVCTNSSFV